MFRLCVAVLGWFALTSGFACSGDAEGGDGAGAGGGAGSGTGTPQGATYTAARACELFAEATCAKAAECGLVLADTGFQLVCVQCTPAALQIIARACEDDAPGDKDAAAVDRCTANVRAASCADACVNAEADGCEVFGELSEDTTEAVVCDERCISN